MITTAPVILSAAKNLEWAWRVAPFAIILLALALRVTALGAQSLWYDEAYTLLVAANDPAEIARRAALDTQQPLYFWLLHFWGLGPPVDFYPRFLSALTGTLCVALTYAIARRLLGARAGFGAALFAAVSPFLLYYSQEVRMYALLGLWNLLAAWGFLEGWERRRLAGWFLYAAGTALSLYTHVLGALPCFALLAGVTLLPSPACAGTQPRAAVPHSLVRRLTEPAIATVAALLLYLPWLAALVEQVPRVFSSFWAPAPSPIAPIASIYLLFEGPFAGAAFAVALAAVLLALGLTLPHVRVRTIAFVWAWAALSIAGLYTLSLIHSVYLERVLIAAAYPVCILLGWAITAARPRILAVPAGAVFLCAVLGLRNWYTNPALAKPPYREAAQLLQREAQGVPVLHTSDGSYLPFRLYAPDIRSAFLPDDPEQIGGTPRARSTRIASGLPPDQPYPDAVPVFRPDERFYLVVSHDHSVEWQQQKAAEFDARYERLGEQNVGGIIVREYRAR